MPRVTAKQTVKRRRVVFSVEATGAKAVALVGDFNSWDPKAHLMKKDGDRTWKKTLVLAPGKYEYKFFIDGAWKEDPQNSQVCLNCHGTQNNVLELSTR